MTIIRLLINKIASIFGFRFVFHGRHLYLIKKNESRDIRPPDYNLSIIIPLKDKWKLFKSRLPEFVPFFERNGLEIILSISLSEPQDEILNTIFSHPFINWKIILNPDPDIQTAPTHSTRNFYVVADPQDILTEAKLRKGLKKPDLKKETVPSKVLYDYRNNEFSEKQCRSYLAQFPSFHIREGTIFTNRYKIIALIQTFNNEKNIQDFLAHIANYCDGIIMFDDGSDDKCFETASHAKLLLKVKGKRTWFHDLRNRNTLLRLASFFRSEWFYFLDTDERFDERYCDIYEAAKTKEDIVSFYSVQLWNDEKLYRKDYPGANENGVQLRVNMFRNLGASQIYTSLQTYHFRLVPYQANIFYRSPILVKHYGNLTAEMRRRKFEFYEAHDTNRDQIGYKHLLDTEVVLEKIENINL